MAKSKLDRPRRMKRLRRLCFSSCAAVSWISIGSNCLSRNSCLTCLGVSPSMRPLRSRPWASSAVYSNAPIGGFRLVLARHAQDLFQGCFARHDLAAAVVTDAGAGGACIAFKFLFGRSVVNHGAHMIVDGDEFVDAGAPAIAVAWIAAGPVELHGSAVRIEIQEAAFIFARHEFFAI